MSFGLAMGMGTGGSMNVNVLMGPAIVRVLVSMHPIGESFADSPETDPHQHNADEPFRP